MELLAKFIHDFCVKNGFNNTYWVAYSGGVDSHVLLHLLAALRTHYPVKMKAIHVHHGLSVFADDWVDHCAKICEAIDVTLITRTVQVADKNKEESARNARYAVFAEQMMQNDILLTAHHQDDQAETLLLQLVRGSGLKGLSGMPMVKSFFKGIHARPLLNFSRQVLLEYAIQNQLCWIDDESNDNPHFVRNFLRHEVLAILKKRWPSISQTLSRVALHCSEAQNLLDAMSVDVLDYIKGSVPDTLSVKKLNALDDARQKQALRLWLTQLNFPNPSMKKLQQIQKSVLQAREDKCPHLVWGEVEMRRYRDNLYVMKKLLPLDFSQEFNWNLAESLIIPRVGILNATPVEGQGIRAEVEKVSVRFRQGGERCQLLGRTNHHTLKKLFQMAGIPPWQRSRLPFLYVNDELVGVAGFFIDQNFVAKNGEKGVLINFNPWSSVFY